MGRATGKDAKLPPVETWNPPFCGDLDIRIAGDGSWFYLGSPIGRKPLVKLFASVLRKDADGKHYLVTPVEKIGITVDDAPFLAVEMVREGTGEDAVLTLRTNLGEVVCIGPNHPLRFEAEQEHDGFKPYVLVRGRLEALFTRALMYDLAEILEERPAAGGGGTGVWSQGVFFPVPAELL
nr:DUF1285 domain-containing protein [Roseibium denhamense]